MKETIAFILAVIVAGCSVGMALSGKEEPNLGAIKVGCTRGEIETQLGIPVKTISLKNGCKDTYEYEIGNKPSAGRAIAHGAADVLTLGLWEIIGTPIEATQGKKYQIIIKYDQNDKVTEIIAPQK